MAIKANNQPIITSFKNFRDAILEIGIVESRKEVSILGMRLSLSLHEGVLTQEDHDGLRKQLAFMARRFINN